MNPLIVTQNQEIHAKFKLGMMRLETAEQNQSALEQALLSFHGALEDHIRLVLSENTAISAETRAAVCDRRKTQWRDLADLAQAYKIITPSNKYFVLGMNKKRQAIAHGKACELSKQEVARYAQLIKSMIKYQEPIPSSPSTTNYPLPTQSVARRNSSHTSSYNIAIGIASVILLVMIIGVIVMITQPKLPALSPSTLATPRSTCIIKGNISINTGARYYHLPGMDDYEATVITPSEGERWFCTEEEAISGRVPRFTSWAR